jgi:serine/threonine protein kinase
MVAIPDEQLANPQLQEWPPSLQWAQQHCQAQSPHLDRWVSSSATLKHLYAVCESVPGLLLSELLQQGPLSTTQAHRMLRDVAMGLKFLHLHRLPHGHLSTHAVVW